MKFLTILALIFTTITVTAKSTALKYWCQGGQQSGFYVTVTQNTLEIGRTSPELKRAMFGKNRTMFKLNGITAEVDGVNGVDGKLFSVHCDVVQRKYGLYRAENCIANDDMMLSYYGQLSHSPDIAMLYTESGRRSCYLSEKIY